MKFTRTASAHWQGSGKEGNGTVSTQSKVLNANPYSFNTRFGESAGTNPEELIGAAHASCFSMKLSFVLAEMGFTPDSIDTSAKVTFEDGKITHSDLNLNAKIPGITEEEFQKAATEAKENCPISLLLNAEISLTATLS